MNTNEQRIKLGTDLENLTRSDGWAALSEYITKNKEDIKELAVNPGFKDFETYKGYVKAYEAYLDLELWIQRQIDGKNKLIQPNEEPEGLAPAEPATE